jgi:hypothetical protein
MDISKLKDYYPSAEFSGAEIVKDIKSIIN